MTPTQKGAVGGTAVGAVGLDGNKKGLKIIESAEHSRAYDEDEPCDDGRGGDKNQD